MIEFDSRQGLPLPDRLWDLPSLLSSGNRGFVLGVKRPGREADHLSLSSDEVRNAWTYPSTPPYVFMAWCLIKQIRWHGVVLC